MLKSMGLSMLGYQGGSMLGGMTGLPMGGMIGGMIGSMLGMSGGGAGGASGRPMFKNETGQKAFATIKPLAQTSAKLTEMGSAGSNAGKVMARLGPIFGRLAASVTPVGIAVGITTAAVAIGIKRWKDHNEHLRIGTLRYGLTAEAAKAAGVKFTDYNKKLSDTVSNITALRERNQLLYESMQDAGTPIKLTIEEYKKLRKEVKSTYADQIKLINQTDGESNTKKLAEDLKTQLMAAGMSAEEATEKIWAMFKMSEKASVASKFTLGNKGFTNIVTQQDAAAKAVAGYGRASREGGREGAASVQTGLTAIDGGISDIVDKSKKAARKDKSGNTKVISDYEAQEKMLGRLNKLEASKATLTAATIREMEKQSPGIKKIATEQDTVVSLWQKMDLAAKGFTGDLSKLGAEAVSTLSKVAAAIATSTASANRTGLLKEQYANLDKLTAQQKALQKAAKGQSVAQQISTRDQLKGLQDQIDKNNKLADARLKALDAAKQEADLGNEIAKAKAKYDAAIATGNSAEAQQASLDMAGLQKQLQYNSQKKAIEDANILKNAPLEAKIKAINAGQQKMSDQAALAGDSLGKVTDKLNAQKQKIDDVNTAMTTFRINAAAAGKTLEEYAKTKSGKGDLGVVVKTTATAGYKVPVGKDGKVDVVTQGLDIVNSTSDAVAKGLAAKGITMGSGDIYINKVKMDVSKTPDNSGSKGQSFGNPMSTYSKTDMTLKEASKKAVTDRQSKQFTGAAGDQYYLFKHGGKTYAVDKMTGVIKSFNDESQTLGKPVKAGYGMMNVNPKVPTIVGDRGPEMLFNNMVVPNMGKVPYASPKYDVKQAALRFEPMRDRGVSSGSGAVVNITNNINGYDGDINQLSDLVTRKTITAIKSIDSINGKMVGSNKNVSIRT